MLSAAASKKHETIAEMALSLLCFEGEKIEVMSNTKEGKHISFNNSSFVQKYSIQVKKRLIIDIHLGFMFCGIALDRLTSFLFFLLCIDFHATHLGFGYR